MEGIVYLTIPEKFEKEASLYFNSIKKNFSYTIIANKLVEWFKLLLFLVFFIGGIALGSVKSDFLKTIDTVIDTGYVQLFFIVVSFFLLAKGDLIFNFLVENLFGFEILSDESIKFGYVHLALENLKHYQANDLRQHLRKANKFLNQFFEEKDFNIEIPKSTIPVNELLDIISKNTTWVQFTEETTVIVTALDNLESKLFKRIVTGNQIENLIPALEFLEVYALGNIKKIQTQLTVTMNFPDNQVALNEIGELYLLAFAQELNKLETIESERVYIIEFTKSLPTKISQYFNVAFYSQNVVVNLVSWFLLFSVILCSVKAYGYFTTETYDTLLLKYAFLGAIALAVGIFKKKQS